MSKKTNNDGVRYALLGVGWLSLALGVVGIFLPVLPTTPFVLLSAACFSRASPRLHRWLLASKAGPYIRDWQKKRVIPVRAKVMAILTMAVSAGLMIWRIPGHLWPVTALVCVILASVGTFILRQRSR